MFKVTFTNLDKKIEPLSLLFSPFNVKEAALKPLYAILPIIAALTLTNAAQATTVGAYSATKKLFYLAKPSAGTVTPTEIKIDGVRGSWLPVLGAGSYQYGLYDPKNGNFHFRLESSSGAVTKKMHFEGFQQGWQPIAGDWDGDLAFGVGLYDPKTGTFYLKNKLASGPADITVRLSDATAQWQPLVGDWDGDGVTTVGAYDPVSGHFHLRNTNTDGPAEVTMQIQNLSTSLRPVAADWNNDGIWSPGLYNPSTRSFYWRNTLNTGPKQGVMKLTGISSAALPVTRSVSVKKPTPAVTEVGTAFGAVATATIGAGGGTLRSLDNGVLLTVPPDALAVDTNISIQPITNHAHGGKGMAYRFLPDGQKFKKPVTLTFNYPDKSLHGSSPKILGGAFQTREGYWRWIDKPVVDTVAKTMTISTTHFTDYARVQALTLLPQSKNVMVNETVALTVSECYESLIAPLTGEPAGLDCNGIDAGAPNSLDGSSWYVNGTSGGGSIFGTVSGNNKGAIYTAPPIKPIPQTVAVSIGDLTNSGIILVSNIEIRDIDAYTGYVEFRNGNVSGKANLTWKQDGVKDGIRSFRATGNIEARFDVKGCDVRTATIPIDPDHSPLKVFSGIHEDTPNRYAFGIRGDAKTVVTLSCHTGTGYDYTLPMPGYMAIFAMATCLKAEVGLEYTDDAELINSADCSTPELPYKASWSFIGYLEQ